MTKNAMTKTTLVLSLAAASVAVAQMPQVPAPVPQGQAPQSLAGVVRLKRAPVSNEVLKVKLPRPVERKLANGATLLILESHRVPTISFRMSLPSGSLRDAAGMPGVSEATAALIRLGTKTRSSKDIADTLADLGAQVSFVADKGETGISVSALTENFDGAMAVLADILLNPTFPQDELEKWKTRQIATLEQAQAAPGFLANEVLSKLLYGSDARQFTHATRDSVNKMTRDVIVEHYKTYYVPSGELAGISGDITPEEAVAKLNKALGAWKGGPVAHLSLPNPEAVKEKKVYLIPRPSSVQTLLVVANHAIDRNSPDYVECQVMNRILGAGPSSRLFRVVREEKGYGYGISSNFSATHYLNHFTASTSVQTAVTQPALEEILKQFADIRDRAVTAEELADAKSAIVASFALGLESSSGVLARWLEQRQYGLPDDYWDTYTQKVMAVTAEDVERVAKKYVPLDNAQIIAVGDGNMGPMLQKFGPVEVVKPVE
ncbi:MAG TPA: pitrilysin family protein [Bryobacteraceae bacterium]|jgi:predicted Zn-dependent peptidase|nr:pitrilysin family protein [Bryobacteraceae bacterium]